MTTGEISDCTSAATLLNGPPMRTDCCGGDAGWFRNAPQAKGSQPCTSSSVVSLAGTVAFRGMINEAGV